MALEQCRCPHCPLFRAWLRDTTTLLYLLHIETRDIFDHLKLFTVTSRITGTLIRKTVWKVVDELTTLQCLLIDSAKLPTQWGMDLKII